MIPKMCYGKLIEFKIGNIRVYLSMIDTIIKVCFIFHVFGIEVFYFRRNWKEGKRMRVRVFLGSKTYHLATSFYGLILTVKTTVYHLNGGNT